MIKFFTLFFCLFIFNISAQQLTQSSIYNHNIYDFNPAVAGVDGNLEMNAGLRKQWAGLVGAPLTQSLNSHLPVYFTGGGFGVKIKNSTFGVSRNLVAALSYNQIVQLNESTILSFGFSGGLSQYSFNGADLRTPQGSYEGLIGGINHNDLVLSETNESSNTPVFNAGLLLKHKSLTFGVSADNLLASTYEFDNNRNQIVFNQVRHYYGYLLYVWDLSEDLVLKPSILVKAASAELQTDITLAAEFKEKFYVGASYRGYSNISIDAITLQGGFRLNNDIQLIYAYDIGLSELVTAHSGSHEILIRYRINTSFGKGVPPPIIYNPRFL
mgnify:CR=1 FL=1